MNSNTVGFYLNQDDNTFVNGNIGLTPTGTVIPPVHTFVPVRFFVSYTDLSNYAYGFGWD
jgi:hypothetical protein